MITILGPTATGKTALAARLAHELGGEVISADSRQVYRGMDIGTGKDYDDYIVDGTRIPVHLIDIVEPGYEYNIFEYQRDFRNAYENILERGKLPVLCGGSGMYLEAILRGYRLHEADSDEQFAAVLEEKSFDELVILLKSLKSLHNITDLEDKPRLIRAILVARSSLDREQMPFKAVPSLVIGINYPRGLVKARITARLEHRLQHGMIEEVERLLARGITPERLMKYGLEYKFITRYITGQITRERLREDLNIAIRQFAKRQMTWFRRMERQGIEIHWIDGRLPVETKTEIICTTCQAEKNP